MKKDERRSDMEWKFGVDEYKGFFEKQGRVYYVDLQGST